MGEKAGNFTSRIKQSAITSGTQSHRGHSRHQTEPVFLTTTNKPEATSSVKPELCINSMNNFSMFLNRDPKKEKVFRQFKKLNRDLTQAFLRQSSDKVNIGKKVPTKDDETITKVSSIFGKMTRPSVSMKKIQYQGYRHSTKSMKFSNFDHNGLELNPNMGKMEYV